MTLLNDSHHGRTVVLRGGHYTAEPDDDRMFCIPDGNVRTEIIDAGVFRYRRPSP